MNTTTHISWRKSSYSGSGEGQCVEIADRGTLVGLRDSKATENSLTVSREAFAAFVNSGLARPA
ncbi:DUF397 domain-containing protein [Streptomyces sp. SM12]|uniref:DUF397 domain-containing protein n=1 Tax=Streptomyces sp. SM12 TaxID=1071602 RepID=UPI000CD5B1FB|nr:DUF397 domain-containing protein [Streptomyces sp. SM12]